MSNEIVINEEVRQENLRVTFDDLYQEAQEIQSKCEDFNIANANLSNTKFGENTANLVYIPEETGEIRRVPLSRYSMSQLCSRVGVPVRYVDKCLTAGMTGLVAENINSWLADFNKSLFIREYNNQIRGILSDRYVTLDTPEIMEVVDDVIDGSQYTTKGYYLSPERFHARIVQNEMMKVAGEDLFAGIQIDSSDVGRSSLIVRFMVFKQVCTNGLIMSQSEGVLFEQRHISISASKFRDDFKESMSQIPILISNSIEMIEEARRSNKSYDIDSFTEKQRQKFEEMIKNETRMSDDSIAKTIDIMTEKYSPTRWGLVNSLTEIAQDFTLERRIEIEKAAGDLLTRVA